MLPALCFAVSANLFAQSPALPSPAPPRPAPPKRHPWFADLANPRTVAPRDADAICRFVQTSLRAGTAAGIPFPSLSGNYGGNRLVAVSWRRGDATATRFGGGRGLEAAVRDALRRAIESRGAASHANAIRLDVVQHAVLYSGFNLRSDPFPMPGGAGLAFSEVTGFAFVPAQLTGRNAFQSSGAIDPRPLESAVLENASIETIGRWGLVTGLDGPQAVFLFETQALHFDGRTRLVFRGHSMPTPLTPADVVQQTYRGAEFLARPVLRRKDGPPLLRDTLWRGPRLETLTDPRTVAHRDLTGALVLACNDCLRVLRRIDEDPPQGRALAVRRDALLKALLDPLDPAGETPAPVLRDPLGNADTEENALALIALCQDVQRSLEPAWKGVARRLAVHLAGLRQVDGHTPESQSKNGSLSGAGSLRTNALVSLALAHAFETTGERTLLAAGLASLRYALDTYVASAPMERLPADIWLTEALTRAYVHTGEAEYLQHMQRLALAAAASQRLQPAMPDHFGCFRGNPSATQAAAHVHALAGAVALLHRAGLHKSARELVEPLHIGLLFLAQSPFDPVSTFHYPPGRETIHGAFRDDLTRPWIRAADQWPQLLAWSRAAECLRLLGADPGRPLPLQQRNRDALMETLRATLRFPRLLPAPTAEPGPR